MNKNLIYFSILLVLIFILSFTKITELFNSTVVGQVDPSQGQIEPIPPSNNTNTEQIEPIPPSNNTNQTTPIVFSK